MTDDTYFAEPADTPSRKATSFEPKSFQGSSLLPA